jgi:phosphoribosylanthranilate isomerase
MAKIKICGLTRIDDILIVNKVLPDYIGFVFAKSRRQITPQQAKILKLSLDIRIKAVGVFVNEDINLISDICNENIIDFVQLHGDEDAEYIENLKKLVTKPIIKAIRLKTSQDILQAQTTASNFLLYDTYHDKEYGGTGIAFDWSIIPKTEKQIFLAGGISTENVVDAIKFVCPYCVDVSSSVETDGIKDNRKIVEFINKVRSVR